MGEKRGIKHSHNFLDDTPNTLFMIKLHFVLTEIAEGFFEVVKQIPMPFQLHYNVINVRIDIPSYLSL
jgi:hypothetical protein